MAAIAMNAPSAAATAVAGWFALTADEPALSALGGVLFALALYWTTLVTVDAWRVLRRFTRRPR